MVMTATLSFLLLLVVVYLIARPFLVPEVAAIGRSDLEDDRARLRARLDDLEMEYSTGKLAEEDYQTERTARTAELDRTERALDELVDDDEIDLDATDDVDDPLERMIAARRRTLAAPACPSCDDPFDPEDHFCRSCGTDLSEVRSR
jgi:DNA repair exonuclease SbcCD ATPase subunit